MAQSIRTRVLRVPKQEQEVRVITNSSSQNDPSTRVSLLNRPLKPLSRSSSANRKRLTESDYEAPLTPGRLRPNSPWLIVRNNLHRVRFLRYNTKQPNDGVPLLYLGFQMRRELKRAQEEIKGVDQQENFKPVKKFTLTDANNKKKIYDTSHVKPEDALVYDRLGDEPLALQNLLYYFNKQEVSHGSIFWDFLSEVNHVLDMNRRRSVLVQRLRKLALALAIILYSILGIMFILLILSVIATATKMNDPEAKWMEPTVDKYRSNLLSI